MTAPVDDETGHGNAPPPKGGRQAPAPEPTPAPPVEPTEPVKK